MFKRRLLWIVLAGAVLRVLYVVLIAPWPSPVPGDEGFYHGLANEIARGHGFVNPFSVAGHPRPTADHPPLYPLVLALVANFGGTGQLPQRLAGVVFGAVLVFLVGLIARRLAGERAGLVAAVLAASYPILIGADGGLMSETLFGALVAGTLWTALWLQDRPTTRRAAALGALIAACALTRGEGLLLVPLLLVPQLRRPGGLRAAGVALLTTLVLLTPWTVRNLSAFHRFVPLSTDSGNLVGGANCSQTYYGKYIGGWRLSCILRSPSDFQRYLQSNEATSNEHYLNQGWRYAQTHLARLPLVIVDREARTWGLLAPFELNESRDATVEDIGVVEYYVLLPLMGYGIFVLRKRREVWVLLAPLFLVLIVTALAYGRLRFREPADVAIVILAGVGISRLLHRVRPTAPAVTAAPAPLGA